MRVGLHVPQWGPDATRDGVLSVARAAEEGGIDSLWVADHVVYPLRSDSRYPYRDEGAPFAAEDGFLEAITTLATIAGATERIALGASVLVLPMREPLLAAKTIATLDVLSGGRVHVAVGVGWWREEFTALGAQFARRGSRMEEQIEILRALWRDGTLSYHGKFYDFEDLVSEPRPVRPGGPPILIGGTTERAKERAGRIGDGWHALGSHEQMLTDGFAEVLRSAREAGRRDDDVILSTSIGLPPDAEHALRRLTRLATAGVSQVVVNVAGGAADAIAAIEMLATRVLPEVKPA